MYGQLYFLKVWRATIKVSNIEFDCLYLFILPLFILLLVLFEDNSVNRMQESLSLFTEVVKNPLFRNTPIFVFLNKKDLFEEMIPKHPLNKCFPDYEGPLGEVQPALQFIEKKYRSIMEEHLPGKPIYVHVIAARVSIFYVLITVFVFI